MVNTTTRNNILEVAIPATGSSISAQLDPAEKNERSHRGAAFRTLGRFLTESELAPSGGPGIESSDG